MKKLILSLLLIVNVSSAATIYPPIIWRCPQNGIGSACYGWPITEMNFTTTNFQPGFEAGDYQVNYIYYYKRQIMLYIYSGHPLRYFQADLMDSTFVPDTDDPHSAWQNLGGGQYSCYPKSLPICGFKNKV